MRRKILHKVLLSVLLIVLAMVLFSAEAGITAFANDASQNGEGKEFTPQELEKQKQEEVYKMTVQTNKVKGWPQGPGTYGEAGIVMEVGSGAILYAKNMDEHEYPASITKVLTALVALENGQLTDQVTCSHESVSFLQPGDSSVGLKEGNAITLEQALHAMLLASANEAAYAIGESVGKSTGHNYNWFLEQMNEKCRELGGENSHFNNTNGLHDTEHYTSARDMALIGRELFKYPDFFRIVQTLEYKIPASAATEEHIFQQKHKMLKPGNTNYYEYAIGGKTGFTSDALSTLITMADNGEKQLVCVVLRTHGKNVYPDTRNLFEYAFQNFTKVSVADEEKSEDVGEIIPDDQSGYVMLPNGATFSDLDMELVPDDVNNGWATLNYTYEGQFVGSARAKLSEQYIEEHTVKMEHVNKDDGAPSEKKTEETKKKKITLTGFILLLVMLIVGFVWRVWIIRRKRKNRRRR